ncbi:hypothetical protein IB286_09015 [Spongiibacter sp. KMU-158]|uniref:Phosphate-selective porin OprO/OprP n=1 Tax=Spongiibacter pelagi TaxID=2760804 RepID=A0A927C354_9GAMM|nr:porin [Spongiibacter pelagi]MBD2859147.1 hypothetical protein [Spongiibacter pelagi]
MNNTNTIHKLGLLGLLLLGGQSAYAADQIDLLDTLVAKQVLTQAEADQLRANQKSQATVEVGKKGLVVKSADKNYSINVGGRIHADFATTDHEDLAGGKDAIDGTEIRRARLHIKGNVGKQWSYVLETDFAGINVSQKDVNVGYHLKDLPFTITAGHQKQAVSMELEESSNDILFTERSTVAALSTPYFDRALGVTIGGGGDNWHFKTGVFGDTTASGTADEGSGFGMRGSYAPIAENGKVLHFGASFGMRKTSDDYLANGKSPSFSYKTSNFSGLKPVEAKIGLEEMSEVQLGILEFAAISGKWSFQSELAQNRVERDTGDNVGFNAQYVQVGYSVFGGQRTYKASEGEFKHLSVQSGGALELALRLDQIDLEDKDISGGKAKRAGIAVNWYPNNNVRIMFDYIRSFDLDGGAIQNINNEPAGDIDTFAARIQWNI